MNAKIEQFGAWLEKQVPKHPDRVRKILSLVYRAVGFQAGRFPSKRFTRSREYLQSYTAGLLAKMLKDPSGSAVVNIFLPCEILHAMDIPVMAPEALAVYVANTACEKVFLERAEAEGASPSFCSIHRGLLGLAEADVLKKPALVANTTLACDANQLSFRHLAKLWDVPHVVIDVPYSVSEESVAYVAEQLRVLAETAQEATGKTLDPERLKECVAAGIRTQEAYRKTIALRGAKHLPEALTPELLNVVTNHLYLGLPEGEEFMERLIRDLEAAPAHTSEKRILWMHILPNWQESVKEIFQGADNRRAEIVGCDLAFDSLMEMDPQKPYESMARRIVYTSYNGPAMRRIERNLEFAKELRAEGILIFCQWGCKQTQGIAYAAKKVFEENGFPTLILDGDACDRANGGSEQIVTRANAFVEQLEALAAGQTAQTEEQVRQGSAGGGI